MKKSWEKPALMVEDYELTQTVAESCGYNLNPIIGGSVTLKCQQENGKGHWDNYPVPVQDYNSNGKIDLDEWNRSYEETHDQLARNDVVTGGGHRNHSLTVDGYPIDSVVGS